MKFHTQYDPAGIDEVPFEEHPDSVTETAGYIPTEKLIHQFEEAGLRLEIARDFDFPGEGDVPDDYDPISFGNRLDALAVDNAVKERLKEFAETLRQDALAKAEAKKAEDVKDGNP